MRWGLRVLLPPKQYLPSQPAAWIRSNLLGSSRSSMDLLFPDPYWHVESGSLVVLGMLWADAQIYLENSRAREYLTMSVCIFVDNASFSGDGLSSRFNFLFEAVNHVFLQGNGGSTA
jgi:hypothetical protein